VVVKTLVKAFRFAGQPATVRTRMGGAGAEMVWLVAAHICRRPGFRASWATGCLLTICLPAPGAGAPFSWKRELLALMRPEMGAGTDDLLIQSSGPAAGRSHRLAQTWITAPQRAAVRGCRPTRALVGGRDRLAIFFVEKTEGWPASLNVRLAAEPNRKLPALRAAG